MKSKIFLIIFIFQIIICQSQKILYRCGVDDKNQTAFPATNYRPMEKEKRDLNGEEFKDFNIYLDLINIKNDIKKFHLENYEELFIKSLNKAVEVLESLLKVKKMNINYIITDEQIESILINDWNRTIVGNTAPKGLKELGIDLIIFGRFDDEMDEYVLASAGACYIDAKTSQPIVGIVNINSNVNYSKINSKEYFQSIIIHEFTHILGFSSGYFKDVFHNMFSRTDENGVLRFFINSPKVLEVAKKYYNCPDIDGVELEDYGGSGTAGSHWEARILLGDYMNGVIYSEEQVISEFTLALLEDTGYYKANYYTGGLMRFGKGKGCDFVKKRCINSNHEINPKYENEFFDSVLNPSMDSSCSSGRQSRTYHTLWIYSYIPSYYQYFENKRVGGSSSADYCPVSSEIEEDNIDAYYTGHCSLKGNGKYGTGIYYPYNPSNKLNANVIQLSSQYYSYYRSEDLYIITGETYSDHSFCYQSSLIKKDLTNIFNSDVIRAICYESFCSSKSLTIKINDDYIVCPRSGGKIRVEGYIGYFLCPDYNLICAGTIMCNDMFDCVEKKSEIKNESYYYDYDIKTSQNVENSYIDNYDDINNYELAENGICPINCIQCDKNKKCIKCRKGFHYSKEKCIKFNIENCEIYAKDDEGNEINSCFKCKDKYFLFFNNLYCIPCDDPLYGQVGCDGNCDATNYFQTKNVICTENKCKNGYYYLNGFCISCEQGSRNCQKCTITLNDKNEKEFECLECLNDYRYKLISTYGCATCYLTSEHCDSCHYVSKNSYDTICDICEEGFYLDSNNKCKKCHFPIQISNGNCRVCSDNLNDFQSGICWCDEYYTKKGISTCVKCPEHCPYCEYNEQTKESECLMCDEGYTINSFKTCTYCGNGCKYCSLSNDSLPICSFCYSNLLLNNGQCFTCPENCNFCDDKGICTQCNKNYTLLNNGKCGKCPDNCSLCSTNENNEITCLRCYDHFALKSGKECVYCPTITEDDMEGCERCGYNKKTQKFECYECAIKERNDSYKFYNPYVFITNTFQCFNNMNRNKPQLYGCLEAYKNGTEYVCNKCIEYRSKYYNNNTFIKVINQNICINQTDFKLSYCEEAENIGTEQNPIYSCIRCIPDYFTLVKQNNKKTCMLRGGKFSFCLEGEIDDKNNYICNKCVNNSYLNNSQLCQCNSDSFGKFSSYCFKCDDDKEGNPGCIREKGCNYNHENEQLNCKQCKNDYFNYTKGQCYSCLIEIDHCEKCHYNTSIEKLICDKCKDGYNYNFIENKCLINNNELKNCEDYPEIYEGCIICEENKDEYISNKKCHKCKPGYFKTKNEQCVNCRSEEYGGPDCLKCAYALDKNGKATENIKCDYCPKENHALSSDGKCYNTEYHLIPNCEKYEIIKNEDNREILICLYCKPGFYMDSEGNCINYLIYLQEIPNCFEYYYEINNISFCTFYNIISYYCIYKPDKKKYHLYIFEDYYKYESYKSFEEYKKEANLLISEPNIPVINSPFKAKCIECELGNYHLNSYGNCELIATEDCSLISIAKNFPERFELCYRYCFCVTGFEFLEIPFINKTNNNIEIFYPYDYIYKYSFDYYYYEEKRNKDYYYEIYETLDDTLKPLFISNKLCEQNYNDSAYCSRIKYDNNLKAYKCSKCSNTSFILDPVTNKCKIPNENNINEGEYFLDDYNCVIENIGTNSNPIYSCVKCNIDNLLLIKSDNDIKYCIYKNTPEIKYCTESTVDTTYINTIYNCNKCSLNFIPYYSEFFGRYICQNIFEEIITEKEIYLDNFKGIEYINATKEGFCERNNFFTPDGKKCYKCNDEHVGMPGCKGACSFSKKRNDVLKCEGECEKGYIEVREGICETCESVNKGCYECHYENEYPDKYNIIKRKRKFVCDHCYENFGKLNGKCLSNDELNLENCEKIEEKNNSEFICTKCNENSVLLENGKCSLCNSSNKFKNNNKCYNCYDLTNKGIIGCDKCETNDKNELICQLCFSGYILLTNNNTCLNIAKNKDLELFESCEKLYLDKNNELNCVRCKKEYSLLKNSIDSYKGQCIKIQILFDYYLNKTKTSIDRYYSDYFKRFYYNEIEKRTIYYYSEEYYYFKYYSNYPCQEAVNLGTNDKPIYSCLKCYNTFEFNKKEMESDLFTRIINKRNNISYCINQNDLLRNCSYAINLTKNGIEKYDCLECINDNKLIYNYEADIHYCQYSNETKKCMVKYCKSCTNGNNYFCNECILSNYEVNSLTGQCVEKSEQIPYIIFKDIFRLILNGQYQRNGQIFYGPSLMLRGITKNQINTRHAFLIYLTFKIKSSLRNLENNDEIILPSICEVKNSVNETSDDLNIVDYECISNNSNNTDLNNYELNIINEGENEGLLKKSNIKELSQNVVGENITKENSLFKFENLTNYVIFEMDKIQNKTAKDNIFNFKIEGKINKEMIKGNDSIELELNEIEDKANCNFIIEDYKKGNLNCLIDINKYKNNSLLTFKTSEFNIKNHVIYASKLNEIYLINYIKDNISEYDNKNGDNKKAIIIGCCVAGVFLIGGCIALIIYLLKRRKKQVQFDPAKNIKKIFYSNTNNNNDKVTITENYCKSNESVFK